MFKMNPIPPSYQEATSRQIWPGVAYFLGRKDLFSASLVCRRWHRIFSSHLWGNMASHFELDDHTAQSNIPRFFSSNIQHIFGNSIYHTYIFVVSLMHLGRILHEIRIEVRRFVHTLHIPSNQALPFEVSGPGWLRDFLRYLPNLQSLIVSNLSSFDHQSLMALGKEISLTDYPLKLLNASNCINTTAQGLSNALSNFSNLIYLDLSATQGVRGTNILSQISYLIFLRVLKMSRCGFKDDDMTCISFPPRLSSLDISGNFLSEMGIEILLDKVPENPPAYHTMHYLSHDYSKYRYAGSPLSVKASNEGVETFVLRRLTSDMNGYLQIEEGLPLTFNHFNLASNDLSINEFCKIYGFNHYLQHLDIGNLKLKRLPMQNNRAFKYKEESIFELIDPEIFLATFEKLRSLRIHHSIITSNPFSQKLRTNQSVEKATFTILSDEILESERTGDLQVKLEPAGDFSFREAYPKKARKFQSLNASSQQHNLIPDDYVESRHPGRLQPHLVPNIRSLTLTGIPSHVCESRIPDTINLFIRECGEDIFPFHSVHQDQLNSDTLRKGALEILTLEIHKREEFTLPESSLNDVSSISSARIGIGSSSSRQDFSFFEGFYSEEKQSNLNTSLNREYAIDVISNIKKERKRLLNLERELNAIFHSNLGPEITINSNSPIRARSGYWNGDVRVKRYERNPG